MKYKLTDIKDGTLLSDILIKNNINLKMPCSGNHTCGKCRIKVQGKLSEMDEVEKSFLNNNDIEDGYRLACFTKVYSDIEIETDEYKNERVLVSHKTPNEKLNPMMERDKYGIAIDIGTTTVVINLFGADSLKIIHTESGINNQSRFGADVISRINYSIQNSVKEIHDTIINQINDMIEQIEYKAKISRYDIVSVVVTGNTTMLHFFAGLNPGSIAFAPFTPASRFGITVINTDIGLDIYSGAEVYIMPCVSGYVGGDTTSCILSSSIHTRNKTSLLVDIGTNGEMVLAHNHRLVTCATAAGPAFEGANITCGMPAYDGAIQKVYYDCKTNKIAYDVIGNTKPDGLCGSGIIDLVAVLLEVGVIGENGKIKDDGHNFRDCIDVINGEKVFRISDSDIYLSQSDVRSIQLAKGAIYAGLKTLMQEFDMDINDIDDFYICGGFGTYLDLYSAEKIGLIPDKISNKTHILGNAAIDGASKIIVNKYNIKEIEKIRDMCEYIELSTSSKFMDNYIEAMIF